MIDIMDFSMYSCASLSMNQSNLLVECKDQNQISILIKLVVLECQRYRPALHATIELISLLFLSCKKKNS